MPAKAPPIDDPVAAELTGIGERIRLHRKQQKVTATTAAEAAGMSRVTLHRIERGEPSVTMGAYMNVIAALGLGLELVAPQARGVPAASAAATLPARIRPDEYPQLKRLAWQRDGVAELTPDEALNLYERNWRHIDPAAMDARERTLVQALVARLGRQRLLV